MFSFSVKPGGCPRAAPNSSQRSCSQRCESDEDCPGKQKCCLFACNVQCMDPIPAWTGSKRISLESLKLPSFLDLSLDELRPKYDAELMANSDSVEVGEEPGPGLEDGARAIRQLSAESELEISGAEEQLEPVPSVLIRRAARRREQLRNRVKAHVDSEWPLPEGIKRSERGVVDSLPSISSDSIALGSYRPGSSPSLIRSVVERLERLFARTLLAIRDPAVKASPTSEGWTESLSLNGGSDSGLGRLGWGLLDCRVFALFPLERRKAPILPLMTGGSPVGTKIRLDHVMDWWCRGGEGPHPAIYWIFFEKVSSGFKRSFVPDSFSFHRTLWVATGSFCMNFAFPNCGQWSNLAQRPFFCPRNPSPKHTEVHSFFSSIKHWILASLLVSCVFFCPFSLPPLPHTHSPFPARARGAEAQSIFPRESEGGKIPDGPTTEKVGPGWSVPYSRAAGVTSLALWSSRSSSSSPCQAGAPRWRSSCSGVTKGPVL
ncbi:hypothetical protein L345_15945, partial [Ophiophagus hannah]